MDKWVIPLITAEFRRLLTLYEVCNNSATSCAMRMPGARDLYQSPRQSIVSSITNDPYCAELYSPVLLDADVSRDGSLPTSRVALTTILNQIVCSRAGFYLDESLAYSDVGSGGSAGFDLSVWRKGFNAPGPQSMYFI